MKKYSTLLIVLISINNLFSQKIMNSKPIVWSGVISSNPSSSMSYYYLQNGNNGLSLTYDSYNLVGLGRIFIGFSDIKKNMLLVQELKKNGVFFCICTKEKEMLTCNYPEYDEADSTFSFHGTDVFDFNKIDQIPIFLIKTLLKKGQEDNQDYLKEFLNIDFKEIKSNKSIVHVLPNQPTKMYLLKNDEVEILEEKSSWLKIRYYGKKTIEGWIKKEDVSSK